MMDEILQIIEMGATAMLVVANIAQWREAKEDKKFIRALLEAEMNREDRDALAERQRRKMGRALGVDMDDTEGRRPIGLQARLEKRGLNKT